MRKRLERKWRQLLMVMCHGYEAENEAKGGAKRMPALSSGLG